MKVAVLGAGISGLTAANELINKGYSVFVFEALPQVGGLCSTLKTDNGFLFDIGGGHIFHSVYKDILDRIIKVAGEGNLYKHARNTKIFIYDRFVKYPFENGLADLPKDVLYECLMGYINAHLKKSGSDYKNFSNFQELILGYFGEGIAKHFMIPYNRKIWCVEPEQMDTGWIKNRIPQAPLEDVVKSALGISTEGYKHQSIFYYPKSGGFQSFVEALAEPVRKNIMLNSEITSVKQTDKGWLVNNQHFDRVISTIPLDKFVDLADFVEDDVRHRSKKMRHLPLMSVLICLKSADVLPYSWVYLPHEDQSEANRVTFFSNYSDNLCPQGYSSILCEATYMDSDTELDSPRRVSKMVADMVKLGFIKESDVIGVYSHWNDYAYILYDLDFESNRDYVLSKLNYPGLCFAGRFGSYRYYNVDQVVKQVIELVESGF